MQKFIYIVIVFLSPTVVLSQTTLTIESGTSLTADFHSGPIYRSTAASTFDYSQFAYLYTSAELSSIPAGATITSIAWNKVNTGATLGPGKFRIYLKNSAVTSYSAATPFNTLISGAILAYDNNATEIVANTGFQEFTFSTPFVYNGGSIEIMVDWDVSAVVGNASTSSFTWQKTSVNSKILGYASSTPITGSLSPTNNSIADITNTRPAVRLTYNGQACSGTPAGGSVIAADSVCSGAGFALGVSGGTTGTGLTYQWQSSSDSISWLNFGTATDYFINTNQTAEKYYRRIIYCGANADTSIPRLVRLKSFTDCYCQPPASSCNTTHRILNVSFGSLYHSSACAPNGYIDYSDSIAAPAFTQSSNVNIDVTVQNGGNEYVALWIDYDQDGLFETTEYSYIGNTAGGALNSVISIPDNIPTGFTKMRVRLKFASIIGAGDACATVASGETEDYLIQILPPIACSAPLSGGTTTTNINAVCAGDSIILSVQNATTGVGGLTYQWQSSPDNVNWQDIPGKTTNTCFVYQDTIMKYRRKIMCGAAESYSVPVEVSMKAESLCYCKPAYSACNPSSSIISVIFGSLDNFSNCSVNGYTDYSYNLTPTAVQAGITLPISVSTTSISVTSFFMVWIDYDHSGTFDSSEHTLVGFIRGSGTMTTNISIPVNAVIGITGMRIRSKFNSPALTGADACTAFSSSETEDYQVNILPPSTCVTGLTAGIISAPADICNGFDLELTAINTTIDNSITYTWQSSADSISWSNISGTGSFTNKFITTQSAVTYYRLVVACTNGNKDTSNAIKVGVRSNPLNCHCVPPGNSVCTIGDLIIRVRFGTIDTTTYCLPSGYGDFTGGNQTDTLSANTFVTMSVQVGCATGAPENIGVWIDFDLDGKFEDHEFTFLGSTCGNTIANNISIPTNALSGHTRLRVRVTADSMINRYDACTYFLNGETEDYKILINPYACPINYWTGAVNNLWENPLNWSCGQVPGVHSNVVINSGAVIISSNVFIYSLDLNTGATLTINPNYRLTITH
jgi:hypothetical protein